MKIYIFLVCIIKSCNAFHNVVKNGVNVTYTISSLSTCRFETDRFRMFKDLTMSDCVTECALRPHCKSLTFRGENVCELFETDIENDNHFDGSCIYITVSDIKVEKSPCVSCKQGQVCDVQSGQCIYKECHVKTIENGTVLGNKYVVGSKVRNTCKPGFSNKIKESVSVCKSNGIWSTDAHCIRDCGNYFQITNGTALPINGSTTFESTATVECFPGYETDKVEVKCQDTGKWETATCEKKDCGNFINLSNGNAQLLDGSTTFESTAKIECFPGYETDKVEVKCQHTGIWETTTCEKKDCGKYINTSNGNAQPLNGSTTFESTAKIECFPGYKTDKVEVKCQDTGKWETATCEKKDCGNIINISNGNAKPLDGSTTFESTAKIECFPGYETDKVDVKCQDTGTWETATCKKKDCGSNFQIINGNAELVNTETTFNSKARVICDAKHESNKSYITCLETGDWETAECIKLVLKLITEDFTWDEAKVNCESQGGRLADIKSAEEQAAIVKLLPSSGHHLFWIGGQLVPNTESYVWLDGTNTDGYEDWEDGEPNKLYVETVLVLMQRTTGYKWHNYDPTVRIKSICEFE